MLRRSQLFAVLAITAAFNVNAHAASDPIAKAQELRQAPMVLIGNNFGFMVGMLKGKIPWDAAEFSARGKELSALGQLDLSRGYMNGSYQGKTRARADIADNKQDFSQKMDDFEAALRALGPISKKPEQLKTAVQELGDNCKSCHKKYKNRDYAG